MKFNKRYVAIAPKFASFKISQGIKLVEQNENTAKTMNIRHDGADEGTAVVVFECPLLSSNYLSDVSCFCFF